VALLCRDLSLDGLHDHLGGLHDQAQYSRAQFQRRSTSTCRQCAGFWKLPAGRIAAQGEHGDPRRRKLEPERGIRLIALPYAGPA